MADDMADVVARLTGECRGQERLNNPDCEVATADLSALLAAYGDAARDREREVEALAEQLYWFDESHHGHEPAKAWENVGAVWQNGWRNRARTILSRLNLTAGKERDRELLREALDLVPRVSDDDPMAPALRDWCRSVRAAIDAARTGEAR